MVRQRPRPGIRSLPAGLLCVLLLGTGSGCATLRTASGSAAGGDRSAVDSTAVLAAAMERRVAGLERSVTQLEELVRGMHADLAAQVDVLLAQLSALNAKATEQDRLLRAVAQSREGVRGAGTVAGAPVELPSAGQAVAYLEPSARTAAPPGSVQDATGDSSIPPDLPLPPPSERRLVEDGTQAPLGVPMEADEENGSVPEAPANGKRLYDIAYRDLMRENFQLALINFRSFLESYPQTGLSDNAQYWIGEAYYAQSQFSLAVEEFRKVMEEYPGQDKVPAACYKIALCFEQLQDRSTARRYLEFLREHFPQSREAQMAQERLARF